MGSVDFARLLTAIVPVSVGLQGRRREVLLRTLDPFLSSRMPTSIKSEFGIINIDPSHSQQRIIAYAFNNLLRDFQKTNLARFINSRRVIHGDIFMDIGANLGIYSLLARRHGFETMVFEPEPNHAQFLQRNKHLFTRVFPIALSDQKGVADFFVGREGKLASSSLVKASGSTLYDHTVPVDVDTFSNVIAENAIDPSRVRLMKVDVEGAEVSVIQGMIAFLESGHRPAIWCEVRGDSKGRSAGSYRTVWDLLKRYDYQAYDDNSLKPFDGDASRKTQVFDLLFQAAETK